MLTILLRIHVIGVVKVATTSQETLVSVITTTIHHVLLDSIHLATHVIGVTLLHQMPTIQQLGHVIGTVIVATTSQVIAVSVITIIIVV